MLAEGVYEGWLVHRSKDGRERWTSLGQFEAGSEGKPRTPQGELLTSLEAPQDLGEAVRFALTIEPAGASDGLPSATKVLVGDFVGSKAYLAFPLDVSMAEGQYALVTPSDDDRTNHHQGIRWLEMGMTRGARTAGLKLPDTSGSGWRYAGWVIDEATPSESVLYPTGRFHSPSTHDDDLSGSTGGHKSGPPAPGQDFVKGTVLTLNEGHYACAVSLEPEVSGVRLAQGASPSMLVLYHHIPAGVMGRPSIAMDAPALRLPRGQVTRETETAGLQ